MAWAMPSIYMRMGMARQEERLPKGGSLRPIGMGLQSSLQHTPCTYPVHVLVYMGPLLDTRPTEGHRPPRMAHAIFPALLTESYGHTAEHKRGVE